MVDLRNSHVIQLLELPIQALLEAPVNNFSLVGTFSSYDEELTVVGNIVSGEEFFLKIQSKYWAVTQRSSFKYYC